MPLEPTSAIRESLASACAHRGSTILVALVCLAMTAATFLTVGSTAATERALAERLEQTGPRLITVNVASPSPGLSESTIEHFRRLPGTEWVLALGPARDVTVSNPASRANVAARDLLSPLPSLVSIRYGRVPSGGEAIAGASVADRLQLAEPSGILIDGGAARALVGEFTADGVIGDLERLILTDPPDSSATAATLIYVSVVDIASIEQTVASIRAIAGVPGDHLQVEASAALAEFGAVVNGSVGALSRQLALGSIASGMLLVALVMTLALNARLRDFGRRRALGASRSALVALTLLEVMIPVAAGVLTGTALSLVVVRIVTATIPPTAFVAAAVVLLMISGAAAALPSALRAATHDPLRTLRVP